MPVPAITDVQGIVFDLDGTLYAAPEFAATIQDEAVYYIARIRGISAVEACQLMSSTRKQLTEESGTVQTLSNVCTHLGGSISELHACFEERLRPEVYLERDQRVITLLQRLREHFCLYIYTNNNRALTTRILAHLGLDGLFKQIFAIDDDWLAKPDEGKLERILAVTGVPAERLLFVGDRYDIDLRVPEQKGCPVFLSQHLDQLLRLEELLK